MGQNNNLSILESLLGAAKETAGKFNLSKSDNDNQSVLIGFTNYILNILDNSFNHYPGCNNDYYYYPRPELNKSRAEYIQKLRELKSKKTRNRRKPIRITNSLQKFLLQIFDVNKNHGQAISLLKAKEKHNSNTEMNTMKDHRLEYSTYSTTNEDPIKINPEGMSIGNFIHAEKGSNVKMQNVDIETPDHKIHINHLNYYPINNGIISFDGVERNAVEWMNECIIICEKLIKIINEKPTLDVLSDHDK
ncbi:MAG: hypothetical protein MJE68_10145 [Proteobacteria bacterium]|nr:hypothetical protein [Pseudomonadota bacterium]